MLAYFGLAPRRRPAQAILGPALFAFPVLVAAYTIWLHYHIAFTTIGSDFVRANSSTLDKLGDFKGELPHSMAFTGWGWLDLILLLGAFVASYTAIDIAFRAHRGAQDPTDPGLEAQAILQGGMPRRAVLVTVMVASLVLFDGFRSVAPKFLSKVGISSAPRYRQSPRLARLDLPVGIYENQRLGLQPHGGASIGHFIRANCTARHLYALAPEHQVPYQLDALTIDTPQKRLDRSARSEAIEWTALQHVSRKEYDKAFDLIINYLNIDREKRPARVNFRLFDLAAGLSAREHRPDIIKILETVAQSYLNYLLVSTDAQVRRQGDLLKKRVSTWNNNSGHWSETWSDRRSWHGVDI